MCVFLNFIIKQSRDLCEVVLALDAEKSPSVSTDSIISTSRVPLVNHHANCILYIIDM